MIVVSHIPIQVSEALLLARTAQVFRGAAHQRFASGGVHPAR